MMNFSGMSTREQIADENNESTNVMAKRKRKSLPFGSFSEAFMARLEKIEVDAKAIGANMTIVCKLAKISRADPVRWTNNIPHTIKLIDRMERVVKKLAEKAKAKAAESEAK